MSSSGVEELYHEVNQYNTLVRGNITAAEFVSNKTAILYTVSRRKDISRLGYWLTRNFVIYTGRLADYWS